MHRGRAPSRASAPRAPSPTFSPHARGRAHAPGSSCPPHGLRRRSHAPAHRTHSETAADQVEHSTVMLLFLNFKTFKLLLF